MDLLEGWGCPPGSYQSVIAPDLPQGVIGGTVGPASGQRETFRSLLSIPFVRQYRAWRTLTQWRAHVRAEAAHAPPRGRMGVREAAGNQSPKDYRSGDRQGGILAVPHWSNFFGPRVGLWGPNAAHRSLLAKRLFTLDPVLGPTLLRVRQQCLALRPGPCGQRVAPIPIPPGAPPPAHRLYAASILPPA